MPRRPRSCASYLALEAFLRWFLSFVQPRLRSQILPLHVALPSPAQRTCSHRFPFGLDFGILVRVSWIAMNKVSRHSAEPPRFAGVQAAARRGSNKEKRSATNYIEAALTEFWRSSRLAEKL